MKYILSAVMMFVMSGIAVAGEAPATPYPLCPAHYDAVKAVLEGKGDAKKSITAMDADLAPALTAANDFSLDRVTQLLTLRGAAERLAIPAERDMALWLLDHPKTLARFLHAADDRDNVGKALGVMKTLRDADPAKFEKWQEFCIAYAVVWDNFGFHHWVKAPLDEGALVASFKFYAANEDRLLIKPSALPFELAVYVVGTRLSKEEREWILLNYKGGESPGAVYMGIPWTMKLSPAHGQGLNIPYTLANIKKLGGCCMDQAYVTENVFRTFGVPAVYDRGAGNRGGHAWAGVLAFKSRVDWNFSYGRYQDDHYYKGEVNDPTDFRQVIPDSVVKMSAAVLRAGSIAKIEEGYVLGEASRWADARLPDSPAGGRTRAEVVADLLEKAIAACPYHSGNWTFAAELFTKQRMDRAKGFYWANKFFDLTVKDFPDFTVEFFETFLAAVEDNKQKAGICAKMFDYLKKNRADLASDVKIVEGDLWMAEGDVKRAVLAYLYPLVNFSQDAHVLARANERFEGLDKKVKEDDLFAAYEDVAKAIATLPKKDKLIKGVLRTVLERLVPLCEKRDDKKKTAQYRALLDSLGPAPAN